MKIAILLDNQVLLDDGIYVFIESLDFLIQSQTIEVEHVSVLIDTSIQTFIAKQNRNNKERITQIIELFKTMKLYEDINTFDFTDFDSFFKLKDLLPDYNLAFITNNDQLAGKVHIIDHDKEVTLYQFEEGFMTAWVIDDIVIEAPKMKRVFDKAFYTKEKDGLIAITKKAELQYVYSDLYGYLNLDQNNVMFGGEGKIYRTYGNLLVKIYSDEERRYETVKKLQRLIDLDLRNKYIVWPKDLVYNKNEFVGYVMEEVVDAKGLDMYRIYSFLNLSYKDRFDVCIKLLKLIDYLHEREILVGDLKFDNILLTDKSKEVYIIDSGSFQLEDYSCGVFNAAYTHDNLKGKNLREVLRTLEEEYFPINKILFEVLMGKGPFYDFKSGEVGSEVEREFHYPMDYDQRVTSQQHPLFYWVNGDQRLRDAFYNYFKEGTILEVKDWIRLLEDILHKGDE